MQGPTLANLTGLARRWLPADNAARWLAALQPSVLLQHAGVDDAVVGRLGGLPQLGDQPWPTFDGEALSHVLSYDCAALHDLLPEAGLPAIGRLAFFHLPGATDDPADDTSPREPSRSIAQLRHVVDGASLPETPAPDDAAVFPGTELTGVPSMSWRVRHGVDDARAGLAPDVVDGMDAALQDLAGRGPEHRVGGFPALLQEDTQLAFAELEYGADTGASLFAQPDVHLDAVSADWFLLAQVDTDVEASMMWGDSGVLYYGIRPADLRACNLDRVRFVRFSA